MSAFEEYIAPPYPLALHPSNVHEVNERERDELMAPPLPDVHEQRVKDVRVSENDVIELISNTAPLPLLRVMSEKEQSDTDICVVKLVL